MGLVGSGILGPSQAEYYDVALVGGVSYRIYVNPSQPGVDFDLYVQDEKGILVAQDTSTASDALCIVTPLWTGPFRLTVKSARGLSDYHIRVEN